MSKPYNRGTKASPNWWITWRESGEKKYQRIGADKALATAVLKQKEAQAREILAQAGRFDERLPRAFYDVDLCLKLRRSGYLIVYTPFARLYQQDSVDGNRLADSPEGALMRERWAEMLQCDPYYNPNLSRARADFSLGS